jgi:polar amino acid transport system substrate-binding protein
MAELTTLCGTPLRVRGKAMQALRWIVAASLSLAVGGCASLRTEPSPDLQRALAPTGPLRVAFLSGPLYATKDPATGELKGVAMDLGRELARRIGVPYQPVVYANPAATLAGAKSSEWDVALMGINPERAAAVDFSAPYMDVEQGFLVRAGVPVGTASEVDKPGTRVAVVEGTSADVHLSGSLKNATLVRTKSIRDLDAAIDAGRADVIAATKASLFERSAQRPGTRVLDGRFLVEPLGMGVPKGRDPAASSYVGQFVEEAKARGIVKSAIEKAGLRGVTVARSR